MRTSFSTTDGVDTPEERTRTLTYDLLNRIAVGVVLEAPLAAQWVGGADELVEGVVAEERGRPVTIRLLDEVAVGVT